MHDSPSNLALLPSFLVFILIFLLFFHMKVKPENALFFLVPYMSGIFPLEF